MLSQPDISCANDIEESKSRLKGWTFEVLATDLNQRSLAAAEVGGYGESVRNIEPRKVRFTRLNLSDDAAMMAMTAVDIILCCNVLI